MRFMSHYFGFCFATLKLDYTCLRLLYLNCFYIPLADYPLVLAGIHARKR